jgi:hypothetical protein
LNILWNIMWWAEQWEEDGPLMGAKCLFVMWTRDCVGAWSVFWQCRYVDRPKHTVKTQTNGFFYFRFFCVFVFFTLDAALLARSQYSEGPATGHLDTGFSWFPCAYKQLLRRFPSFQVATTCFSCSPPDLNLLLTNFMFCLHVK